MQNKIGGIFDLTFQNLIYSVTYKNSITKTFRFSETSEVRRGVGIMVRLNTLLGFSMNFQQTHQHKVTGPDFLLFTDSVFKVVHLRADN